MCTIQVVYVVKLPNTWLRFSIVAGILLEILRMKAYLCFRSHVLSPKLLELQYIRYWSTHPKSCQYNLISVLKDQLEYNHASRSPIQQPLAQGARGILKTSKPNAGRKLMFKE